MEELSEEKEFDKAMRRINRFTEEFKEFQWYKIYDI